MIEFKFFTDIIFKYPRLKLSTGIFRGRFSVTCIVYDSIGEGVLPTERSRWSIESLGISDRQSGHFIIQIINCQDRQYFVDI
jgi:hypothetical protein